MGKLKKCGDQKPLKKRNKFKIKAMRKIIYLIPILGLIYSCSGEKKRKAQEVSQEQIEVIEKSTQKLEESIKSSEYEIEKKQSEIDSLLSNI